MKFWIETLGCKVNSYESNYMKESLLKSGFLFADNMSSADIIIVNTCTVTNIADNKCLKLIRRIKREAPNALLCVVGCSVQNNYETYKKLNIPILLGNKDKSKISTYIKNYLDNKELYRYQDNNRDLPFEEMTLDDFEHARAYIKIEDGCDNFCSYCIIPFVRGKIRCKDFNDIIKEAKNLVKNNHKEIVLTGINTGAYLNNGHDLVDVVNELSKIPSLLRIRLSSVEVTELNAKFMEMLKVNPKFCDHLHIPLQSGSNTILKLMNRKYDMDYFFHKIEEIRKIRPNISITTDIIVGFPKETEECFMETYHNAQKLKFSKIHVFPYSKRDGTKASLLEEVSNLVKKERVQKLLDLSKKLENAYEEQFIGKRVEVLIEEAQDNISIGHTSNYLKVIIPKKLKRNDIYEVEYEKSCDKILN